METMRAFIKSHPLITLIAALIIGEAGTQFIPTGDSPWLMAIVRFVLALIMLGIIALAASPAALSVDSKRIGYSLKKALYVLILAFVLALFTLIPGLVEGRELAPNWISSIIGAIVLAFFVGIFEEGLFRVITIGAFLRLLGNTKKGVFWTIVISSVLFGFVHNTGFLYSGEPITATAVIQMVLKTIQTGMMGFLFGAIYLKTKSLWGVAIIHSLTDFFLFAPEFLFGTAGLRNYVQAGDAGMMAAGGYIITIILYIPALITAWKILKTLDTPVKGIFDKAEKD